MRLSCKQQRSRCARPRPFVLAGKGGNAQAIGKQPRLGRTALQERAFLCEWGDVRNGRGATRASTRRAGGQVYEVRCRLCAVVIARLGRVTQRRTGDQVCGVRCKHAMGKARRAGEEQKSEKFCTDFLNRRRVVFILQQVTSSRHRLTPAEVFGRHKTFWSSKPACRLALSGRQGQSCRRADVIRTSTWRGAVAARSAVARTTAHPSPSSRAAAVSAGGGWAALRAARRCAGRRARPARPRGRRKLRLRLWRHAAPDPAVRRGCVDPPPERGAVPAPRAHRAVVERASQPVRADCLVRGRHAAAGGVRGFEAGQLAAARERRPRAAWAVVLRAVAAARVCVCALLCC